MKRLREVRGWSQRDLAAKSGVAQNTISQLERGERKAMPSTVRKLADALEVEPSVLIAEFETARLMARGAQAISRLPPEAREEFDQAARELDIQIKRERRAYERAAAKRQAERKYSGFEEEPQERSENREWAEEFVSGDFVTVSDSFPEEHKASIRARADERFLRQLLLTNVFRSLVSYPEDRDVARSRLASSDPKEIVKAAQLVLRRAKKIVEEYDSHLQSFNRIPERYYADPAALSRDR